jgi:sarcosine oxidase subunit alpha
MVCRSLFGNPILEKSSNMAIEKADIVIIGAGPAGLAAAAEVARYNGKVIVLDEAPVPGGRLPGQIHPEPNQTGGRRIRWSNGMVRAANLTDAATRTGAKIICGISVWGIFPGWHVAASPVNPDSTDRAPPAGFEARAVIIATGAVQNPLMLPGWTLPGVITAGAAQTLINVHHILPGRKAVVVGLDPLSLSVAHLLAETGTQVHGIVLPFDNGLQFGDSSPRRAVETLARFSHYAPRRSLTLLGKIGGKMSRLATMLFPMSGIAVNGSRLLLRHVAMAVEGRQRAERIVVADVTAAGMVISGRQKSWPVDVVITSAGLSPLAELAQVVGCPLVHVPDLGGWVPLHNQRLETPLAGLFVAGSVTGVEASEVAETQGRLAGAVAAGYLGLASPSFVESDVSKYQEAAAAARKITLAFLPDIEKGRRELFQYTIQNHS